MSCKKLSIGKNVKQHENAFGIKDRSIDDKFDMIFRNLYSASDKL